MRSRVSSPSSRSNLRSNVRLRRDSQQRTKKLGREVSPVRPHDRTKLGMESYLPEIGFVTERLENLAVELISQIDFTFKTIREPQPQRMASAVLSGDEARKHGGYSKGSMRGSGLLALARLQMAAKSIVCRLRCSCTCAKALGGSSPLTAPDSISTAASGTPLKCRAGQSQAIRTIACHASIQVGASDARGPECEACRLKRDRRCRTESDEVADVANAHAKGHRAPERREARRPSARTPPQTATRVPDWLPLRRTQHHRQAHLRQADE